MSSNEQRAAQGNRAAPALHFESRDDPDGVLDQAIAADGHIPPTAQLNVTDRAVVAGALESLGFKGTRTRDILAERDTVFSGESEEDGAVLPSPEVMAHHFGYNNHDGTLKLRETASGLTVVSRHLNGIEPEPALPKRLGKQALGLIVPGRIQGLARLPQDMKAEQGLPQSERVLMGIANDVAQRRYDTEAHNYHARTVSPILSGVAVEIAGRKRLRHAAAPVVNQFLEDWMAHEEHGGSYPGELFQLVSRVAGMRRALEHKHLAAASQRVSKVPFLSRRQKEQDAKAARAAAEQAAAKEAGGMMLDVAAEHAAAMRTKRHARKQAIIDAQVADRDARRHARELKTMRNNSSRQYNQYTLMSASELVAEAKKLTSSRTGTTPQQAEELTNVVAALREQRALDLASQEQMVRVWSASRDTLIGHMHGHLLRIQNGKATAAEALLINQLNPAAMQGGELQRRARELRNALDMAATRRFGVQVSRGDVALQYALTTGYVDDLLSRGSDSVTVTDVEEQKRRLLLEAYRRRQMQAALADKRLDQRQLPHQLRARAAEIQERERAERLERRGDMWTVVGRALPPAPFENTVEGERNRRRAIGRKPNPGNRQ